MPRPASLLFYAALCLLPLAGCDCGSTNNSANNSGFDPNETWAEPTHITPEGCEGCEEIEANFGHGESVFLVDREADDEVSQWARCVNGFMLCVTSGQGNEDSCIENGVCPGMCKAEYARRAEGSGDDIKAKVAAVDATFFNEGAPCKPAEVPGIDTLPSEPPS